MCNQRYKYIVMFVMSMMMMAAGKVAGQTISPDPVAALGDPELLDGIDAYMKGQYDQCYTLFTGAYKKNPDLAPPGVLLALLFSNSRQYISAFKYLEKAADENPEDPEAYYQLAGIAIQESRYLEARMLIAKGNETLEKYAEARVKLQRKTDSRLDYLRQESLSLQANLARYKGDFVQAEKYIREIIANGQSGDTPYQSLGYLLFEQGKYDDALKAYNDAKQLNEKLNSGWLILAEQLQKAGKTDESQKLVEKYYKAEEVSETEMVQLARLDMRWGRMKEASDLTLKIQAQNADSPFAWILQGELALYRSEFAAAEDLFRRALLALPSNFEANNGMALALADQRNKAKLRQGLETARLNYQRYSDSIDAIGTYAWLLFLSGRPDDADVLFSPLLDKGEVTATIAYYMAEIAHTKGASGMALDFIDIAMADKTNFPKKEAANELKQIIEKKFDSESGAKKTEQKKIDLKKAETPKDESKKEEPKKEELKGPEKSKQDTK